MLSIFRKYTNTGLLQGITLILSMSMLLSNGFVFASESGAKLSFMEKYYSACGGDYYTFCDDPQMNQVTILEDAKKVAMETNRSLFVIAGADWCPTCRTIDETLKSDPESLKQIESEFVVVKLNADRRSGLESATRVEKALGVTIVGYPTLVILSPERNSTTSVLLPSAAYTNPMELLRTLRNFDQADHFQLIAKSADSLGDIPVEVLDRDIDLSENFGEVNFMEPPSVFNLWQGSRGAPYVNAGLARLYAFHYLDAVRAFRQALRIDPSLDMARIFLAISYAHLGGHDPAAAAFIHVHLESLEAKQRDDKLDGWYEFTKSFIQRRVAGGYQGSGSEPMDLEDALFELVNKTGGDIEAYVLGTHLTTGFGAVYEAALNMDPDHVGAHHYLIHYHETMGSFVMAKDHAERMVELAPDSAHAHHMLGHILPRLGEWTRAREVFEHADSIHQKWSDQYQIDIELDWHFSHNLDLLGAVYFSKSLFEKAFNKMLQACRTDIRGCFAAAKVAVITSSESSLKKVEDVMYKIQPENSRLFEYLDLFKSEMALYQVSSEAHGYSENLSRWKSNAYLGMSAADEVLKSIFQGDQDIANLSNLALGMSSDRLDCTSFDGWASGFLDVMRVLKAAEHKGLNEISYEIRKLIESRLGIPAPQIITEYK